MSDKKTKINRFNNSGPFMQDKDMTKAQIKRTDLMMKAQEMAEDHGDFSLGVKLGMFSESVLEEDNDSN